MGTEIQLENPKSLTLPVVKNTIKNMIFSQNFRVTQTILKFIKLLILRLNFPQCNKKVTFFNRGAIKRPPFS